MILADLLFHQNKILTSLSWVVPSSVVWVEVGLGWVEAELELKLSWDWAWQVFELFNWSIWSLQLKYLKTSIEVFEVFNWSIWSLVPFYFFHSWVGGLGKGNFWFFNLIDFFSIRFFSKITNQLFLQFNFSSKIHW